ncbi:unnamed protein product [Cylindrotheca closterium]|uniref:TBCC domain-containing protein 1 n=1 Tax=Cylindrotheca closterium TaxID=2856 RepID=A0AAD2GCD5_9STRA|nr:unnamed protein product [Cylindrotheca closterium]
MSLTAKPHAFAGAVLSPDNARRLTPSLCLAVASALAEQSYRKTAVSYTLWISEAWRGLGWAQPSAALFWEMASMYHTLFLAGRAHASDFNDPSVIPPILSCGSTSSIGSGSTHHTNGPSQFDKKKQGTAKELPVWLITTFLLLHCEENAYMRNLSGIDDRRFYEGTSPAVDPLLKNGGAVDFANLLKHPYMSPRTRLHAGWNNDNSHCTAYLLRHLRKLLLLAAVSHNTDAMRACMHLASIPSPNPPPPEKIRRNIWFQYSPDEIRRQHDEEHGNVGLNVRLTMEDLERLHLWLQSPSGGGVDEPEMKIAQYLWSNLYSSPPPPTATIPVEDVEREVRKHLELELLMAGADQDDGDDASTDGEEAALSAFSQLTLNDSHSGEESERAHQPEQGYQKELSYMHLRGTTILLKPNSHETPSGSSSSSGDHLSGSQSSSNRLHDLAISDCSDVHMYLLQPFEHVTIAACTGCTIVVGAVAGLLHIVDCEKTTIVSAARRILVSNSSDTVMFVFTPSPPLLVGDNRNCQFAPYNTYYDGFREDLIATGLAASAAPDGPPAHHGSKSTEGEGVGPWPPLQFASNKWKQPVEVSRLEMPQGPATPGSGGASSTPTTSPSPGADDKAVPGGKPGSVEDNTVHAPVLLPPSEFHVLFVPLETESMKQKKPENAENGESQYCRILTETLQLSPFRLPIEYERSAVVKADRMRSIQEAVKTLTDEQRQLFEEELNRGFREWLVTSGNLRQVLDLVHLERRAGP